METPFVFKRLLGWQFAAAKEQQCVDFVLRELDSGHGGWIVTVNLDHLRRLVRDQAFAELCRRATLLVADGMPLIWASRLQGNPLPERVAGSSLISTLSSGAAKCGRSVFLLGGAPGTAEEASQNLRRQYPELEVVGTYCPTINGEAETNEAQMIRTESKLRLADPDIVFVALGSPKQEILIDRLREKHPRAWWFGVGISFSYLSGRIKQAPPLVRRVGLEWLYRLVQEPHRLTKRYLRDDLPFFFILLFKAVGVAIRRARFHPTKASE